MNRFITNLANKTYDNFIEYVKKNPNKISFIPEAGNVAFYQSLEPAIKEWANRIIIDVLKDKQLTPTSTKSEIIDRIENSFGSTTSPGDKFTPTFKNKFYSINDEPPSFQWSFLTIMKLLFAKNPKNWLEIHQTSLYCNNDVHMFLEVVFKDLIDIL